MSQLMDMTRDIGSNIENTLMFALVACVNALASPAMSTHTSLMICAVFFLSMRCLPVLSSDIGHALCAILVRVNVIIFADAAFCTVSAPAGPDTASVAVQAVVFTHSTVLLLILAMLNSPSLANPYTQRVGTLVLFMYTESIQSTVGSLDLGVVSVALALLVYTYIHRYQARIAQATSMQYIVRAVNMLAINSTLSQFTNLPYTLATKTMLMLVVLVFLDLCTALVPLFGECRGYALWKAARYLQSMYQMQFTDPQLSLYVSAVVLVMRRVWPGRDESFTELAVLICVNVVVNDITASAPHVQGGEAAAVLFVYIIALDILSSLDVL